MTTNGYDESMLYQAAREAMLERDNHRCTRCGTSERLEAHHIVAKKDGGSDELDNLTTLCYGCHRPLHWADLSANPQVEDGYTRIANELLDAVISCKAPGAVIRMALAVVRETYGFNRKTASIDRKRLEARLGVGGRRVRALVAQARDWGLIRVVDGEYSLQKNHRMWGRPSGGKGLTDALVKLNEEQQARRGVIPGERMDVGPGERTDAIPGDRSDVAPEGWSNDAPQMVERRYSDHLINTSVKDTSKENGKARQGPAPDSTQPDDRFRDLWADIINRLQPTAGAHATIRPLPKSCNVEEAADIRARWLAAEDAVGRDALLDWCAAAQAQMTGRVWTGMGHLAYCEEQVKLDKASALDGRRRAVSADAAAVDDANAQAAEAWAMRHVLEVIDDE